MITKIDKKSVGVFLFGLCVLIPYLSIFELSFLIWCTTFLLTIRKKYSSSFIKYSFCFVSILVIAFFATFFKDNQSLYLIIRDITYLSKPFLGLFIGYHLIKYLNEKTLETIIYCGFIISIIHFFLITGVFIQYKTFSVALLREECGYFSDFEVYAFIILLFSDSFNINIIGRKRKIILFFIGFSSFMYLSRNNFIQFVILFLALKGSFVLTIKSIKILSYTLLLFTTLYLLILSINPKRNGDKFEEFLYKIKVAPTEPFKNKVNRNDYKDFNVNYRSVEKIFTIRQMSMENTLTKTFGKGLGSSIDLKQKVFLGDKEMRHISVMHNAFMTTYLKSGLLGVLILIYSIYLLLKSVKSEQKEIISLNYLLVGSAVFLLVSNWVLMGYYFTMDSKSILIGLFIGLRETLLHKNQQAILQ